MYMEDTRVCFDALWLCVLENFYHVTCMSMTMYVNDRPPLDKNYDKESVCPDPIILIDTIFF